MKKKYLGWALFVGLMMTAMACSNGQNDMEMPQTPDNTEEMVECFFTDETADTKVSVTDKMKSKWDAGDKVTLWIGDSKTDTRPCVFKTENGGNSGAAFHGMVPKGVNSLCYYAFYPEVNGNMKDGKVTFRIPADGTVRQKKANSSEHLAAYRAMYAPMVTRTVASSELTGINFKQLTSLLVFDIMNMRKQMVDVSEVVITADKPVFYEEASFEPAGDNTEAEQMGEPVKSITLSLGNTDAGVKLDAQNGRIIAYLPIVPSALFDGASMKLMLKVDGKELASLAISADDFAESRVKRFEQGKFYIFYLDVLTSEIHWDVNKSIADWENGGVIDIPV